MLSVDKKEHDASSLSQLKADLTKHFDELLKSANVKMTQICKLDKEAWRNLDNAETESKEKMAAVERLADEQVTTI